MCASELRSGSMTCFDCVLQSCYSMCVFGAVSRCVPLACDYGVKERLGSAVVEEEEQKHT